MPTSSPANICRMSPNNSLRRQYQKKFGPWAEHLLLTRTAAEQTTSYATAQWKAKHIQAGCAQVIDVCAGLEIDALARAQHGQRVTALELDPLRADLLPPQCHNPWISYRGYLRRWPRCDSSIWDTLSRLRRPGSPGQRQAIAHRIGMASQPLDHCGQTCC